MTEQEKEKEKEQLTFSDLITLKLIDIKKDDLTESQIKYAIEYNLIMTNVQEAYTESNQADSAYLAAENLQKMAAYRQRIGKMKSDLDYECKKITSEIECDYRKTWEENHFKSLNSTACNKLAEAKAYTPEREKKLRIAEWLYDIFETSYETILGLINATNRVHDDLKNDWEASNRRHPG